MPNTFLLKIVTPTHDVYNGEVQKVFLKNAGGNLEILANHAEMITSTIPSIVKINNAEGEVEEVFVSTAIVNVDSDGLTICSDAAEKQEDIDFERAEKAKVRAERRLKESNKYNKERAELALLRAVERIKLKK
ncbi:ATP synthase F1 subunit epsilon [Clostridium weizhouense]|uniref:ATP synthase epsilon chain n=1 Tax=Clostridium weizhouense TaxID=2859781 RepID=A0ABS7AJP5_9CLOT|nr:ATP synthase F1 subunit epsilon [Clostridium weizhouense]MBW6408890.1 ATP synthase F1 subunit epsilon [Clostridium weizhouense]